MAQKPQFVALAHNPQFSPLTLFWYPPLTNHYPFLPQGLNSKVRAIEKSFYNILFSALALVMALYKLPNKNDVRHFKKLHIPGGTALCTEIFNKLLVR